jgi:hypothetical protein
MNHEPVMTLAEYDSLDPDDVVEGYEAACRGDPEPGLSWSQGYWRGWRAFMMTTGATPIACEHQALAETVRARLEGGSSMADE